MSEVKSVFRSVQVGTVDFFGILLPGLLATVTTIVGFFMPIFLFVWNATDASWPFLSVEPAEPLVVGFVLALLVVFSYVLGYILRLSSPDELDKISARNVILRELDRLSEHYEKHPEENKPDANGKIQEYKVQRWFRPLLRYPGLRKMMKRILRKRFAEALTKEEEKFSMFVTEDAWPYDPNEPLDKYPYFNFYWYLEHRGHTDLANLVNWGWADEDSKNMRSKTVINRMKMDVRNYCPQLSRHLESKEGHIRLMAGTWSAFRMASPLVVLALFFTMSMAFIFPQYRWYFMFSFLDLLLLALMSYSVRWIEKLFHYRRVSELFHIVQAAYLAQQMRISGKINVPPVPEEAD